MVGRKAIQKIKSDLPKKCFLFSRPPVMDFVNFQKWRKEGKKKLRRYLNKSTPKVSIRYKPYFHSLVMYQKPNLKNGLVSLTEEIS